MKRSIHLFAIGIVVLLFASSCSKSGSDINGATTLQFQLKTSNPVVVVNRMEAGTITWTSGLATATQTKLEAKQNANEVEFKTTGIQQIDLFASVIPNIGSITLPNGTYTEVEFKISLNQNGSTPAMELNGTYTNSSGTPTPVVFTLNTLFDLKAEQNNVTVTSGTSLTALTTLDLSFMSNGITQAMMNSATVISGKIQISASSNVNLYNIILNNLQRFHHVDITHH